MVVYPHGLEPDPTLRRFAPISGGFASVPSSGTDPRAHPGRQIRLAAALKSGIRPATSTGSGGSCGGQAAGSVSRAAGRNPALPGALEQAADRPTPRNLGLLHALRGPGGISRKSTSARPWRARPDWLYEPCWDDPAPVGQGRTGRRRIGVSRRWLEIRTSAGIRVVGPDPVREGRRSEPERVRPAAPVDGDGPGGD